MKKYNTYFHKSYNKHLYIISNIIKLTINYIKHKHSPKYYLNLINKKNLPITKVKSSIKSIQCFTILTKILNIEIQYSCHKGEYYVIINNKKRYVDGFHNCSIHKCNKTHCIFKNVIFEFQGNYVHGNHTQYHSTDKFHKIPYSEIWKRDKIKQKQLEKKGYKVIYIWESFIDDLFKQLLK